MSTLTNHLERRTNKTGLLIIWTFILTFNSNNWYKAKQLGTNFNLVKRKEFCYSKLLNNLTKETSHLLIWYVSKYNWSFNQCPLYLIINILVFILTQHGIAVYYFTENTRTLLLENEQSIKLLVAQNNLKGTILIKQSEGEVDVYGQGSHVNSMNVRK